MAGLQLQVPERVEHGFDHALAPGRLLVREQEEQIDIGARRQRATPVAANSDDRDPLRLRGVVGRVEIAGRGAVQPAHHRVHHGGEPVRTGQPTARSRQDRAGRGVALVEQLPEPGNQRLPHLRLVAPVDRLEQPRDPCVGIVQHLGERQGKLGGRRGHVGSGPANIAFRNMGARAGERVKLNDFVV